MADTIGRAEQMILACRRNGVKLGISHQRRFLPAYTLARDLIAQGAIGKVQTIQSFGGDGLPNYSSHQTDMYRYLLGDDECDWVIGNVERKTDRYERGTRIEDCAVGVFHFSSRRAGAAAERPDADGVPGRADLWQRRDDQPDHHEPAIAQPRYRRALAAPRAGWRVLQGCRAGRRLRVARGRGRPGRRAGRLGRGRAEHFRGEATHGLKALQMVHAVYESARMHEKVLLPT